MKNQLEIFKGLHPGIIIGRKLKKRKIPCGIFALSIGEYLQTMNAVIHGRRGLNMPLSLKIEKAMNLEEGSLMALQMFYDIKQLKQKESANNKPYLSKFRPVIFWDTDINTIDWNKQKRAVIERVFQRGDETERKEITRFYGEEKVSRYLANLSNQNK
jgi:plasmid maintenance system antidote protein VapI